jgi:hypothetical protein
LASRRIDSEIDRLYQLPPDEFTAARNALAKDAGADRAEIRALVKPPIAAWAVNQVYWKERDIYDALIAASIELRKAHKAILAGRAADIRDSGKAHDAAVESALKAALTILRDQGHPATDATRQAIMTTLRALPGNEPPGRLTGTLQPGGFEMLAGLSLGAKGTASAFRPKPEPTPIERSRPHVARGDKNTETIATHTRKDKAAKNDGKAAAAASAAQRKAEERKAAQAEAAQARLRREAAARAVREAEQAVRREQFEAARLTREAREADKVVEQAQQALEEAREALQRAETRAAEATRERDAGLERSRARERELQAAREAARKP